MNPRRLSLVTAPARLPVTLDEVKQHLRLEEADTEDHALLFGLIRAAADECEKLTGRALITQTWQMFRDAWPGDPDPDDVFEGFRQGPFLQNSPRFVEIPNPPLQSVAHVKTYDDSDTATTWSTDNYFVDTVSVPGRVVARKSQTFPTVDRVANGIEIQFTAGHGDDWHDVPEPLRLGINHTVAAWYEDREAVVFGDRPHTVPNTAKQLWHTYKVHRL